MAGSGIGGMLVFLGGLTALDICPKDAAGAAVGFIGIFSYLGASIQSWISGTLLEMNHSILSGVHHYDFARVKLFWIGAAFVALFLSLTLLKAEQRS